MGRRGTYVKVFSSYWSEMVFVTFDSGDLDIWPSDPEIHQIPLFHMTDVWTKFEEGMSRRSSVIEQKRKGYRQTDQPTYANKQYVLSSSKGGIKSTSRTHCVYYFVDMK